MWRYVNFYLLTFRPISFFFQLFKLTNFKPCHNQQSLRLGHLSPICLPLKIVFFFFIKIAANRRLKVSENTHVMLPHHLSIITSGFTITFLDYFLLIFFSKMTNFKEKSREIRVSISAHLKKLCVSALGS